MLGVVRNAVMHHTSIHSYLLVELRSGGFHRLYIQRRELATLPRVPQIFPVASNLPNSDQRLHFLLSFRKLQPNQASSTVTLAEHSPKPAITANTIETKSFSCSNRKNTTHFCLHFAHVQNKPLCTRGLGCRKCPNQGAIQPRTDALRPTSRGTHELASKPQPATCQSRKAESTTRL